MDHIKATLVMSKQNAVLCCDSHTSHHTLENLHELNKHQFQEEYLPAGSSTLNSVERVFAILKKKVEIHFNEKKWNQNDTRLLEMKN